MATAAYLGWCPPLSFNSRLMSVHGIAVIYDRVSHVKQKKTGPVSLLQSQIISVEPRSSAYSCQTHSLPHSHYLFSHSSQRDFGHWRTGEFGVTERPGGSMCGRGAIEEGLQKYHHGRGHLEWRTNQIKSVILNGGSDVTTAQNTAWPFCLTHP